MSTASAPSHLLLLHETLTDDLVDGRFCKRGGDWFSIAVAVAIIGEGRSIGTDVVVNSLHSRTETRKHQPTTVSSLQGSVETLSGRSFLLGYEQFVREQPAEEH